MRRARVVLVLLLVGCSSYHVTRYEKTTVKTVVIERRATRDTINLKKGVCDEH